MESSVQETGATLAVDALIDAGVDTVFAITGAGNLALLDEIHRRGNINVYFLHHEQAVVMAAQGYSRVSGLIGVAIVTTGGGTSNAMTGILSAHLDSVPVLIISGNESSFHCESGVNLRAWGVQGFNSVDCFRGITKDSLRAGRGSCVYSQIFQLVELALQDRMGPVHLDFPMDLQRSRVCPAGCQHQKTKLRTVAITSNDSAFESLLEAIQKSSRPLFYFGNGCRKIENLNSVRALIEKTEIPFFLSWSAIDLFDDKHPLNLGRIGIYGERASNLVLQKADLLVCFGTRLAIPQVGYDKSDFARGAEVWVIDIDSSELEKFTEFSWRTIHGDVGVVAQSLVGHLPKSSPRKSNEIQSWVSYAHSLRKQFDKYLENEIGPKKDIFVHSVEFIQFLNENLDLDAIIVTDVGAGLLSGHYAYTQRGTRRFFTSQGLGEMGFGLPAAIGAHFASCERQLVCLNTDGAVMFNLQELQSIRHFEIPIKLVIFNNEGYAMIKISQNNLFEGREFGSSLESGISFPNFRQIAKAFDLEYFQVSNIEDLGEPLREILSSNSPTIIEVMMDPDQKYLPRLATSRTPSGDLISPPIEDLDPKISLKLLQEVLGKSIHESSGRIQR